ncbi:4'-phosphopantetheinyl transferase superfamily protein [Chitinophaga sp. CF118]|uniref:4'-phosphopantetheinyl transferase family protein n=1 Tax=Chitinophaga sp. CF118 TaxID=1884367 RepID=UPI0008E824FB|nr:4'-phosphopantetheinyl transferase superfamily protein [Chitinophaga sp. CF118]SFD75773.1 4'-phosphopantetheinyl transferase superfamily protein [Chitinophaga sp. CF118]
MDNLVNIETLFMERATGSFSACIATSQQTLPSLQTLKNSFLHPDEHTYFNTLKAAKRQHSYLHGRYTAKQAVAAYTQHKELADIKIATGVFQQPILQITNVQLSISHTEKWCVAVIYPEAHPMGVDVELISPQINESINEIITEKERGLLPSDAPNLSLLWTIKEALSKTLRTGLMTPLQVYEVSKVIHKEGMIEAHFTNFAQYKSLSWISGDHAWSIVLPLNSMPDPLVLARIQKNVR